MRDAVAVAQERRDAERVGRVAAVVLADVVAADVLCVSQQGVRIGLQNQNVRL